ncbi:hypothetical protein BFG52_05360 [Acinetobacter larvae]|uniref:Uncharacterized protein n=2 Tax=Acinetobacter larvae TaxID=1789224 RepID=A0A1B2LY30_9GAMM|nr:hypothetical protein BFG52_05360 [Acinetobacter larvae]
MAKEYRSFYMQPPAMSGLQHDFVIKPKRKAFSAANGRDGLSSAEYQALAEIDCLQMKTDLQVYEFIYNHFDELSASLKQSGFNDISLSKEDFEEEYRAFKDQAENPNITCM